MREVRQPTVNDQGEERHPAWGLIGASRVQSGPPGASLFDSDIHHQHYVVVRLSTASRRRDLNHDYIYPEEQIVEFAVSEAQWASFVSSMNVGNGVSCTIQRRGPEAMPDVPHAPRLENSMSEVRDAGEKAAAAVRDAFAVYEKKRTVGSLRSLRAAIENMPANMEFAAKSLSEHAENVVQKARADIEAMVLAKAEQIGLDPGKALEIEGPDAR